MDAGKKNSSYKLTSNDLPLNPRLNSVPSSDSQPKADNLQLNSGEIIHDEQTPVSAHISKNDISVALPEDLLDQKTRQNQPEETCTHVILQKKEKGAESNSMYDSEVSKCTCRSEKGPNYYTVNVKSEPTTIVITRRGSKNTITAEGSWARFRAGGSTQENALRKTRESKGSVTVWDRKPYDDEQLRTSTSEESVSEKSCGGTDRCNRSTFQRLTGRGRSSKRKSSKRSDSRSPCSRRSSHSLKKRLSSSFCSTIKPKERRYLGPGPKSTGPGPKSTGPGPKSTDEENTNKCRRSRGSSFFSKRFSRRKTSKASKCTLTCETPSRISEKPKSHFESEPMYVTDAVTHHRSTSATGVNIDKGVQTDYPYRFHSTLKHFLEQHLRACDSCGMPTIHLVGKDSDLERTSSEASHLSAESQVETTSSEESPFIRRDYRTTFTRVDEPELPPPSARPLVKCPPKCSNATRPEQSLIPEDRSSLADQLTDEVLRRTYGPKHTSYQPAYSPVQQEWSSRQPVDCQCISSSEYKSSFPPSQFSEERPVPDTTSATQSWSSNQPSSAQQTSHFSETTSSGRPMSTIRNTSYASSQPGNEMRPEDRNSSALKSSMRQDTVMKEGKPVHCSQCGASLQTEQGGFKRESKSPAKSSTKEMSHVLWALAKVKVYKDGSRSFEMLESTTIPPGHYLMPANEDYKLVPLPVNR